MRKAFQFVIIAGCLLSTSWVNAMPRLGRESDAVVQSVDSSRKTFTINVEAASRLRSFEWDNNTQFYKGTALTSSRALCTGARVRVRYHAPFFGKPFATKVVFLNDCVRRAAFFCYSSANAHIEFEHKGVLSD